MSVSLHEDHFLHLVYSLSNTILYGHTLGTRSAARADVPPLGRRGLLLGLLDQPIARAFNGR